MTHFSKRIVLSGGHIIYPETLKHYLAQYQTYFLNYNFHENQLCLTGTDTHRADFGTVLLLKLVDVSYETALHLAELLEMKSEQTSENPTSWAHKGPHFELYYDDHHVESNPIYQLLKELGMSFSASPSNVPRLIDLSGKTHRLEKGEYLKVADVINNTAKILRGDFSML